MNKAYNEIYLEDAMRNLGTAFDFAKNSYNIEMDDFYQLFINSGLSEKYEKGNVKYVSGMSGIELVLEVLKNEKEYHYEKDYVQYDYSCEYWCGWILAYFQWFFGFWGHTPHQFRTNFSQRTIFNLPHWCPVRTV